MVLDVLFEYECLVVFVGFYEYYFNEVSWCEMLVEVVEILLCVCGNLDLDVLIMVFKDFCYVCCFKIGLFSVVSNVIGLFIDICIVVWILYWYGVYVFFDFVVSVFYVVIDMKLGQFDGYDVVFFSLYKFVGGFGMFGLLCFCVELYCFSSFSMVGGGMVCYVSWMKYIFVDDIEVREDVGMFVIFGKICMVFVFWVKEEFGVRVLIECEYELFGWVVM